jgi:hypothetical protein
MERASLDASDILKEHQPLNLFYFIFVVKALGVKMLIKKNHISFVFVKKKGKAQRGKDGTKKNAADSDSSSSSRLAHDGVRDTPHQNSTKPTRLPGQ